MEPRIVAIGLSPAGASWSGPAPEFVHFGLDVYSAVVPVEGKPGSWTTRAMKGARRWTVYDAHTHRRVADVTGHRIVWADASLGVYCHRVTAPSASPQGYKALELVRAEFIIAPRAAAA